MKYLGLITTKNNARTMFKQVERKVERLEEQEK